MQSQVEWSWRTTFNDQNSHDPQSPLTREAAVKAVKRLYETTLFATFVPADEIVCGVTEEAMAAGAKLPAVSYDDLPDWHGICLSSSAMNLANGVGKCYDEEEIRLIAEQGFNMIRAQMDYRDVFPGTDTTRAAQGHSGAGSNIMGCQKTTAFASVGGVRRCGGQAFFDKLSGRKNAKRNGGTTTSPQTLQKSRTIIQFLCLRTVLVVFEND